MNELKNNIEEFNKIKPVSLQELSRADLQNNPKFKALVAVINSAIDKLKRDAKEIFDSFNVNIQITSSDKLSEPILNAINFDFHNIEGNQTLDVSANFNFIKLSNLPGEEVFSCVYSELFKSLLSKKQAMPTSSEYKFGKIEELNNVELGSKGVVNDSHFDRQGNFVEPKNIIVEYIKKFLKAALGIENSEEKQDYQSAKNIADEFIQSGISVNELFENPNGSNIVAERYAKVSKKGTHEQAMFLAGEFTKEEFERLKIKNPAEVQAFCDKFARSFLANSGLSENSYQITFNRVDSEGNILSAGTYTDFGSHGDSININLAEILKIENPAEIVMTLSHELTHLVDSAQNKRDGKVEKGGYGLLDNLVGGTGEVRQFKGFVSSDVYDFMLELETVCYRINPNEVSARLGEIVALEFMENLHADADMRTAIANSRAGYDEYIKKINRAMIDAEGMRAKFDSIKGLIRDKSIVNFIESRLNYIEQLKLKGMLKQIDGKEQMNVNAAQGVQHSGMAYEGLVQQ